MSRQGQNIGRKMMLSVESVPLGTQGKRIKNFPFSRIFSPSH